MATYATAIREHGLQDGRPIGVLAVFFDWAPQASSVVKSVRLSEEEWSRTRCMLVDARFRVLASSDDKGALFSGLFPFVKGKDRGVVEIHLSAPGCNLKLSIPWGKDSYQVE